MKKLFVMAFAAMISLGASAQLISSNTVTHKEGNNYSRLSVSYNALSFDKEVMDGSMSGVSLAWTKGIAISSTTPLFIETGLGVTGAWKSDKEDGIEANSSYIGMSVPVNVVYKWNIPNTDFTLAPYAGVYLRGNLYGETEVEESHYGTETTDWFDSLEDGGFEASRFSFGWNVGLGVEYSKLYVGLSYGGDFNNFIDIEDEDAKTKINTFSATVGFKF